MKKNIAIVAGGNQSEVIVSMKSAAGIYSFLNKEKYNVYTILIIEKRWYAEYNAEKIEIDKNDFSFTVEGKKITFDCIYITIHGIPGEDGRLQGYFDLIKIPYTCCGVLAASLTFNKFFCNNFLRSFGVKSGNSILFRKGDSFNEHAIINELGLPCFIKPNIGGSSFGVTKVKKPEEIRPAISKALAEGDEVIMESFLKGTEITCGVYKTATREVVLPITEVISENEFFDFDAKYNGQVREITPARISPELTRQVQELTSSIYNLLGAKGIIRIDYIITENNEINLLEVNTNPGMTPTSFIPQQVAAAGLNISDVMDEVIEDAIKNSDNVIINS
jgi:D-alanine-D-alanine ligase